MQPIAAFQGRWIVSRVITDHRAGQTGHFEGEARITPSSGPHEYFETGTLEMGTARLQATRRYLWSPDPDGIAIAFDDGRPFHIITDSAKAEHFCDPDQYDVSYDFTNWPDWSSVWSVSGPRKSYVMTTHYRRP